MEDQGYSSKVVGYNLNNLHDFFDDLNNELKLPEQFSYVTSPFWSW